MACISKIAYYVPENVVTNDELALEYTDWSANKIFEKTGIMCRHISNENETALDLAIKAAEKLFIEEHVDRESIDFVIFVTQSPDYLLPTTACILQDRLKLRKNVGALDINLGCSGFVYGLATAKAYINAKLAQNVLLVTSETYTKHINRMDKSTRTIFGDGAAATLVSDKGLKIGSFVFGTDGSGDNLLRIPASGLRIKKSDYTVIEQTIDGNTRSLENLYMDGTGIFEFTIREVPLSIQRVLAQENLSVDDIDLFVLHQANKFMLDFLRKQMKIPKDKFYMNFSDIGNTVSASIPIALKRALSDGYIKPGNTILLSGFGVGLSWASTILKMEEI